MSQFTLTFDSVSDEKIADIAGDLASGLPDYYPKATSSQNYGLLQPIAEHFANTNSEVVSVEEASSVEDANSIEELVKHGELVGLYPQEGEGLEEYRARLKAEFVLITGEGTIKDILLTAAYVLDISPNRITFENAPNGAGGTVRLTISITALNDTPLTQSQLATTFNRVAAASYTVDVVTRGTLTYITPNDYNAGNIDATKAYDGLDANGDPKDNGGTYAGLVT